MDSRDSKAEHHKLFVQTFFQRTFYQQKYSRFLQVRAPLLKEQRSFPAG
jgi:hypothetical protein